MAASYRSKGNEGLHTGNHPLYGYLRAPDNKEQWIVDSEAADVVKRIYAMTIDGKGPYQIANILQGEKVYCPSYYLSLKGVGNHQNKAFNDPYRWWGNTVVYILDRMEYMGHTCSFKTFKNHYRDKNRKKADKADWKITENTHEAIIDQKTWETAQRCRKTVRRIPKQAGTHERPPNRLTGLIYCADCGKKMYNDYAEDSYHKTPRHAYFCSSYRRKTADCTMHFVRAVVVEELILASLREVSGFANENEAEFIRLITQASSDQQEQQAKAGRKRLDDGKKRIAELDRLIRKIYEDNANGKLSDKRFEKLSAEYEGEQDELEQSIITLQADIDSIDEQTNKTDRFLELTKRYTDFTELTTLMLHEFIEKVVVHERVKGGRYSNSQQIDIYFNFVGMVELPNPATAEPEEIAPPKQLYVAKGSSFEVLGNYLKQQNTNNTETITLTYSQIEEILGKPLCKSAYKFYSYWSPSHNRPAGNVIYNAGFDVAKVDVKGQKLYLRKVDL
ncbi:MAG: DUF4368 domain-containing protein [Defluviitaleaceae bacterium]|nr:DUF4368 domain-containing protein [Defluviitaleaceae bacterium]